MNEEKNTNNEFSKEKLENTILNLKMLSEIKENDKLYLDDSLLKLDHPYLLQGLTRWYNNYSRTGTIEYLDILVNNINLIYDHITNSNNDSNCNNEYDDILQKLLIEINGSCKGLTNLKLTYRTDIYIKSKIDIILDKLKTIEHRINKSITIN